MEQRVYGHFKILVVSTGEIQKVTTEYLIASQLVFFVRILQITVHSFRPTLVALGG